MASMRVEQVNLVRRLEERWPGEVFVEYDVDDCDRHGGPPEYIISVLVESELGEPRTVGYGKQKQKVSFVTISASAEDDGREYHVSLAHDGQWGTSFKCADYTQMVEMALMFTEELRGEATM